MMPQIAVDHSPTPDKELTAIVGQVSFSRFVFVHVPGSHSLPYLVSPLPKPDYNVIGCNYSHGRSF
jgi:hypothetical protein